MLLEVDKGRKRMIIRELTHEELIIAVELNYLYVKREYRGMALGLKLK